MNVTDYGRFVSLANEGKFLLLAILLGIVLGSFFDLFRTLRVSIPHNGFWVAVEDFFYCLLFAFCWYVFCVDLLDGTIRFYILLGMAAGFLLHHFTLGRIVIKFVNLLNALAMKLLKNIGKLFKSRKNP